MIAHAQPAVSKATKNFLAFSGDVLLRMLLAGLLVPEATRE
jgi:hypothetical protein